MLTINADDHPVMKQFHPPTDEKRELVKLERDQINDWLNATTDEAISFFDVYSAEMLHSEPDPLPARTTSRKRSSTSPLL